MTCVWWGSRYLGLLHSSAQSTYQRLTVSPEARKVNMLQGKRCVYLTNTN